MKFRFKSKRQGEVVTFNNIVSDVMGEFNLEKLFTIEAIRSVWVDLVGDIMSSHSIPNRIFHGVLFVYVDHSVFANELIMMHDAVLQKIEDEFHIPGIRKMKVEIKKINWSKQKK